MPVRPVRTTVVTFVLGAALALGTPPVVTAASGAPPGGHRGPDGPDPAVREVRTPTSTAAARGLRVRVVRPPAARSLVAVRVVGPRRPDGRRFRATIRRTRTWANARPGVYRITARTITFRDQRIVPTVSRRTVRIGRNRARRTVVVRYGAPVFCARSGTRVLGWGDNAFGQLGTPGRQDRLRPLANRWLRGVTAVTGGLRSTYALCRDGSVWSWGFNGNGELGIGRSGDRVWPVRIPRLRNITAIAAADQTAYALRADGTVWAWGSGRYGQLGDGTSGFGRVARTPVRVQLSAPASAIAAGGNSAYAVRRGSGEVVSWGNGGVGQRGDGTTAESTPTPVQVSGLSGVVELAAGHTTVFARTAGGFLFGWGDNGRGQLAGTPGGHALSPQLLVADVDRIGASHSAGYAVVAGTAVGWGSGRYQDTGRNTFGNPAVAAPIAGLTDVRSFAGAGYGGYALLGDGTVWSWGDNGQGQLGTGAATTGPSPNSGGRPPAQVAGLTGVRSIGAGAQNGYAVR